MLGMNLDELLETKIYWDNLIDESVKKKGFTSFDELLEYARRRESKGLIQIINIVESEAGKE